MSEPVARLIEYRQGRPGRVHELGLGIHTLGREAGVDGRKVAETSLEDGSRFAFGELTLVLEHPGARVSRVLQRSGEPTVRRPRPSIPDTASTKPGLLGPALAAAVFTVLLILLLVFG